MNSLPASSNAQTRFPDLLENALSTAREHLLAEPSIPGGMAQCIEIVVLDHALCKCHFYEMHTHCASCADRIVYDGDGPMYEGGSPVAVLPDGARVCAECDLELHTSCADTDGLCILCHLSRHPEELRRGIAYAADSAMGHPPKVTSGSAAGGRDSADNIFSLEHCFSACAPRVPEDPRFAELRVPTEDVYNARCAISTFWLEHITACTDPEELIRAQRDLDDLAELVAQRRNELGARVIALTNLSLESDAA